MDAKSQAWSRGPAADASTATCRSSGPSWAYESTGAAVRNDQNANGAEDEALEGAERTHDPGRRLPSVSPA